MAEDIVVRAEGIGKKYTIGHEAERERYVALRDVLVRGGKNAWRRTVDVARGRALVAGDKTEEFWALKDISFEVKRGEVLGIIGQNGAGKSTLLKILSRITEPTKGRAIIRGRLASLLEVGTGFHPELTGRENIYLNGAILGMTRAETKRKFDEIVGFADVEKFIDTPTKRYSSGMYVRLAFAVAANLEPEILVVDEVLAVGDVEFQRRCLGKMQDVSRAGRTILFVSHNMAAVKSLTHRALVINAGQLVFNGRSDSAIEKYGALTARCVESSTSRSLGRGKHTSIVTVRLLDQRGMPTNYYASGAQMRLEIEIETDGEKGLSCDVLVVDQAKSKVAYTSLSHFQGKMLPTRKGVYRLSMSLEPLNLAAGQYSLDVATAIVNTWSWDHYAQDALSFKVQFANPAGLPWNFRQSFGHGAIALAFAGETTFARLDDSVSR
jgi:lipopolysaccharide transport system ATP-binding protein